MGTAYENALARKAEIQQELEEIEKFLSLWAKFSRERNAAAHGLNVSATKASQHTGREVSVDNSPQKRRRGKNDPLGGMIREVIMARHKPMTRTEILAALEANGHPIEGKDPSKNLGTVIWRLGNVFVQLPGHGYWPSDVAYPPAGYAPIGATNVLDDDSPLT